MKMYDPGKLTMRSNWSQGAPTVPGPKEIAAYYAATTAVDDQIGRLAQQLKSARDRTGHHCFVLLRPRRYARFPWTPSEAEALGGVRFAFPVFSVILAASRQAGRSTTCSPKWISHRPYFPCAASNLRPACRVAISHPWLSEKKRNAPDSAFFQIFGPYQGDGTEDGWRGIRTQQYMYARFRNRPWVLYDLQKDPHQKQNLAGERSAASIQAEMEKRLSQWMERTGDSWSYNWSHLVEDKGRLYRHKTFYTVKEYLKWAAEHPELEPQ